MKKYYWILLLCLCVGLSGCSSAAPQESKGLSVVSVSFPGYSFAKEVAGSLAEVTLLLPTGSEAHSYEPTPKDIIKIQNCDVFIYGGGESEHWVKEVLSSLDTPIQTVAMTECTTLLPETHVEGMEETEHSHEEGAMDEHVWTDPNNAIQITSAITDALCAVSPDHEQTFRQNAEIYTQKLKDLDAQFASLVSHAARREIIVGDRFPFLYMANRYGLTYYAAFPGCAGESEPGAATVAFLIEKVRQDNIPVVFYTEFSNQKVAKTICEATGAKPLLLHSCHNVSKSDFEQNVSYYTLMQTNLAHLKEALS